MHWTDGNWGWGILMMLLVLAAVVATLGLLFRGWNPPRDEARRRTAEDILEERFARGEIEAEEFERRSELLRDHR
jgi:putative membrane protein